MSHSYLFYTREDTLCQTNGYFSLNLTKKSADSLKTYLEFKDHSRVLWAGCGDARELLLLAQAFPKVTFVGYDLNNLAIDIGRRVLSKLQLQNVSLVYGDVTSLELSFDNVYSTALAGPLFYKHLVSLCAYQMYVLAEMKPIMISECGMREDTTASLSVSISGSGEKRRIIKLFKTF